MSAWGYVPVPNPFTNWLLKKVGHPHPYGRLRAWAVVPYLQLDTLPLGSSKILDLGCGEGVFLRELLQRGHHVIGLEIDPDAVGAAKHNLASLGITGTVVCGSAEKLPFDDSTFELVYATDVLEHLSGLETALEEVRRVLKPDGRFIVSVPTPRYLSQPVLGFLNFAPHLLAIGHVCPGWYRDEFKQLVAKFGFEVRKTTEFGFLPMQLIMELLLASLGTKGIHRQRKEMYQFKLSTLLKFILLTPLLLLDHYWPQKRGGAFLVAEVRLRQDVAATP